MSGSATNHRAATVAALRSITYLLERSRAERYRTRAFRGAVGVVEGLTDADFDRAVANGTIKELKGIGSSTAGVIADVVAGREPDYLTTVRASAPALIQSPMLGELRGDLHSHSDWSDGATPILAMAQAGREMGRDYQALTDHSPRLRVANGLSRERLEDQLEVVAALNADREWGDFRLLAGIEVDILADGSLDQDDDLLERLDIVVASVHSQLRMPRAEMTSRLVAAVQHPRVNVLGHCTGRKTSYGPGGRRERPPSEFEADTVFAACRDNRVAVEINSQLARTDPPDELIDRALELGCLFSIDSDAHAPGELTIVDHGAKRAQDRGVPPERVVNTWPLTRLLDWSGGG